MPGRTPTGSSGLWEIPAEAAAGNERTFECVLSNSGGTFENQEAGNFRRGKERRKGKRRGGYIGVEAALCVVNAPTKAPVRGCPNVDGVVIGWPSDNGTDDKMR